MKQPQVVVIGGGATGTGIIRDLSMRGIRAVLLEQGDLASGTSSRFHGLLHSGARYVVNDPDAARECIAENMILRRIGRSCVEETEGYFVRTPQDDAAFEPLWTSACAECGIEAIPIGVEEARRREPNLAPDILAAYRVPDSAVDGFRLVWHNAMSARRHGGDVRTYRKATAIRTMNGAVCGVESRHVITGEVEFLPCDCVINASGSWAGEVARLAGLEVTVSPDRGTLLAFNHRFTNRVVNRLRKPADGDIFVPHGSIVIFGTTSATTNRPDDTCPRSEEVTYLLDTGKPLFPRINEYRILRAFAGTRPLYSPGAGSGRSATRNFVVLDHAEEGLGGMFTITGGKFTAFRLMAEKVCDSAAAYLGVTTPCRTAEEAIIPDPDPKLLARTRKLFPAETMQLAVSRLGDDLETAVAVAEKDPWKKLLLCECEMVTLAEFETAASEPTSHSLGDVRRRTRLGMGTCQGSFCALRATGVMAENNLLRDKNPQDLFRQFLQERWHGIRPLLWGNQLREIELERGIYCATLNIDGANACSAPFPSATACEASPVSVPPLDCSPLPTLPASGERDYDVIVVGAGFSGLVAAATAAYGGKRVLVVASGAGALTIGGGGIDLLGYTPQGPVMGDPFAAMSLLAPEHPYRLIGEAGIQASLDFMAQLAARYGQPPLQAGSRRHGNAWMPTAAGTMKPTWMTGATMNPAALAQASSFAVLGISGMKDFSATMTAAGLAHCPAFAGKPVTHVAIPSPMEAFSGAVRDASALDLARFADTPRGREWLRTTLATLALEGECLLVPSILGTGLCDEVHAELEQAAKRRIVELFCPPPSVTGLRLHAMLMNALASQTVSFVEGATVTGAVTNGGRCLAIRAATDGKQREYRARSFIIATGGLFGKGIATAPGKAVEPIFGIPLAVPKQQEAWSQGTFFTRASHPFATMGITANARLNPLDSGGNPLFDNVHFVGRSLGGYDFALEKSGSGVALATGHHAGTIAQETV